jgi:hypothetical protein
MRVLLGFIAGFLSVLIFQNGLIAILHAVGAVPFAPWPMTPLPPFGVPRTVSAAFWGGLWGIAYALLEPRLTERVGWWQGGLLFGGTLPVLVLWFVVMPLKGMPAAGGFAPVGMMLAVVIHAAFGLGASAFFRLGLDLAGRRRSALMG